MERKLRDVPREIRRHVSYKVAREVRSAARASCIPETNREYLVSLKKKGESEKHVRFSAYERIYHRENEKQRFALHLVTA